MLPLGRGQRTAKDSLECISNSLVKSVQEEKMVAGVSCSQRKGDLGEGEAAFQKSVLHVPDRLVNVVNTELVGNQEPHEQSATDLVRAGRCERARRRYFDHHREEYAQHHLLTLVGNQSNTLVSMYVTIKVSTRNHKVSSKNIVTDQYSGSAFYPRQRDTSVKDNNPAS